jgi:hypothetical protein
MDHLHHDNINIDDNSVPRNSKLEEEMDLSTPMPSRKRKMSQSIDHSPAKRTFTGSDLCDDKPSSSFVSYSKSYIPQSFMSILPHTNVRANGKLADEVQKNYSEIKNYLSDKHPLFFFDSIINILNGANISSGKRVLVYDEFGGLITVSALKLLKGNGEVWFLFEKFNSQSCPAFKAIDSSKELNTFRLIRLSSVTNILPSALMKGPSQVNDMIDDESMDCESSVTIRPRRLEFIPKKIDVLPRFESLLVLSDMISPVSFLEAFYNCLLPSATVAVFTHSEEEAQMVQAFLIAANARNINVLPMTTFRNQYEETFEAIGHYINAIKSS